jgi:hypothetical protein
MIKAKLPLSFGYRCVISDSSLMGLVMASTSGSVLADKKKRCPDSEQRPDIIGSSVYFISIMRRVDL